MALPLVMSFRYTTVFATSPSELISRRSRSRTLCDSGSHVSAFFVIGNLGILGIGPVHRTVPVIVPGSLTVTTVYSDCAAVRRSQKLTPRKRTRVNVQN